MNFDGAFRTAVNRTTVQYGAYSLGLRKEKKNLAIQSRLKRFEHFCRHSSDRPLPGREVFGPRLFTAVTMKLGCYSYDNKTRIIRAHKLNITLEVHGMATWNYETSESHRT